MINSIEHGQIIKTDELLLHLIYSLEIKLAPPPPKKKNVCLRSADRP